MPIIDTDVILLTHMLADAGLIALVTDRIFVGAVPQNTTLPCVTLNTRGGDSTPYIPGIPHPSVQIDSWGGSTVEARAVHNAVYNCLQGIQNIDVVVGVGTYQIMSAIEEVQGQDLQDPDVPEYFRVLGFFKVWMRASLT